MPEETEIVEEEQDESAAPDSDAIENEVILEGINFPGKDDEEPQEGKTEEKDAKPKEATIEDRIKELETKHQNASQHIQDLKIALHQARQENKALKSGKKEEEDFSLTDEQVEKILEEHGNDFKTVVRVINYQAAKAAHNARTSAVDDVETKQLKSTLDAYLAREWPDVLQEDSKVANDVQMAIDKFRLADNPFNRFLAGGALLMANWTNILKSKEEAIRKELLGEKAEDARKKMVKGSKLTEKGSDKASEKMAPNIQARAKQMGLNPRAAKIYAKLLGGDSKKVAAFVEAD